MIFKFIPNANYTIGGVLLRFDEEGLLEIDSTKDSLKLRTLLALEKDGKVKVVRKKKKPVRKAEEGK